MGKIKVYVLMISRVFPAYHPRRGEPTHFMSKILLNSDQVVVQQEDGYQSASKPGYASKYAAAIVREDGLEPKITTIRENYDLWARRAEKINRGEAVLSLRQWSGSPYNYERDGSTQVEFLQLKKMHVQKFKIITGSVAPGIPPSRAVFVDDRIRNIHEVAKNDGLSVDDFCKWFKKDVDGCVIQLTDFKY